MAHTENAQNAWVVLPLEINSTECAWFLKGLIYDIKYIHACNGYFFMSDTMYVYIAISVPLHKTYVILVQCSALAD